MTKKIAVFLLIVCLSIAALGQSTTRESAAKDNEKVRKDAVSQGGHERSRQHARVGEQDQL
jgi:hypothetical protein